MEQPSIKELGGIYTLAWPGEQLAMRFSHIHESRSGDLGAEVMVRTAAPGVDPQLLHHARINLLSTRARSEAAKALQERLNGKDWQGLIQQACTLVSTRHRQGEPIVQMRTLPPREGLYWQIEPLISARRSNIVYGTGGSGKSYLAVYLSVLMDGMVEHNGLAVEPGPVLYLDYETDAYELDDRVAKIQRGLGIDVDEHAQTRAPQIHYRFCSRALAYEVEELQAFVAEQDVALVVVDALGSAVGAEINDMGPNITFYNALRSLRTSSLILHHTNKEGKMYGNNYIYHQARNVWALKAASNEDEGYKEVGLFHEKSNTGRKVSPIGLRFSFTEDSVTVQRQSVGRIPELEENLSLSARIWNALDRGLNDPKQIAEELDANPDTVKRTIRRYPKRFYRSAAGLVYKLTQDTDLDTGGP